MTRWPLADSTQTATTRWSISHRFSAPTATLLLHRLARYLTGEVTAQTWTISELAASLGVIPSTLTATLARLDRFGMIRVTGDRTQVRARIPPLSARHLSRLPAYLAVACPYQHSH